MTVSLTNARVDNYKLVAIAQHIYGDGTIDCHSLQLPIVVVTDTTRLVLPSTKDDPFWRAWTLGANNVNSAVGLAG